MTLYQQIMFLTKEENSAEGGTVGFDTMEEYQDWLTHQAGTT